MKTAKKFTGFDIVTVGFIVAYFAQPAHAGWSGAMNGIGYGSATVNVRAYDAAPSKTKYLTTGNTDTPSAAIAVDRNGYEVGAGLPSDASSATEAKVKGSAGYIWDASTVGSDGDSTDHTELESRITITAADCASLEMSSSVVYDDPSETSGTMIIQAKATAGAALWTRGIQYAGVLPENIQPLYDEDGNMIDGDGNIIVSGTFTDAFKEELKANGQLKWDVLYVGPFDLSDECSAIKIPFNTTNKANLYFLTDGVAKGLPLVIECPNDIPVECGTPVQYPQIVWVGGCGPIAVAFNPQSPPTTVGTHIVTVTATDTNSNTASCTFNVIINDTTPPLKPTLADIVSEGCAGGSVTPPIPTTTDACDGPVTGTTTTLFPITATTEVTWTFEDDSGNVTIATQNVIVEEVEFDGFYSPLGGTGGSCGNPLKTIKLGSKIPIKFKTFCNGENYGGGTPPHFLIEKCGGGFTADGECQFVANAWHGNFDTSQVGVGPGDYTITVTLQDGITQRSVVVRLK